MDYLAFLKLLLSHADKLPRLIAIIQELVADVQDLLNLFPHAGAVAMFAAAPPRATAEEMELETQVMSACATEGEFGGPLLDLIEIFRVLKASGLLEFIKSLFDQTA